MSETAFKKESAEPSAPVLWAGGRQSKIDRYGLRDLGVDLFSQNLPPKEMAAKLTAALPDEARDAGESITVFAVHRFIAPLKEEAETQVASAMKDYARESAGDVISMLDSSIRLVSGGLSKPLEEGGYSDEVKARIFVPLVPKLAETHMRLANLLDSGDKRVLLSLLTGTIRDMRTLPDGSEIQPGTTPEQYLTVLQGGRGASVGVGAGDDVIDLTRIPSPDEFNAAQKNPAAWCEMAFGERYTEDVRNMMQSVVENPITIAKSANATGKTHAAARVAAWWYTQFPGAQVYTAAAPPEDNLKTLLWGEIGEILEQHPQLFRDDKKSSLFIQRSAKVFIKGVAIPMAGTPKERQGKFSGKHAPFLLFIVDEGDSVPDEVYDGIESCMSGGFARLLIMFNPRGVRGKVRRMEDAGQANVVSLSAFRHPNVITGRDEIPGAVTRDKTVVRINQWCRPLVEGEAVKEGDFSLPDFLVGCTAIGDNGQELPPLAAGMYRPTDPSMFDMVLGEYPPEGAFQLVSERDVHMARARWDAYVEKFGETPPKGLVGVYGQDVAASDHGDENCSVCRWGGFVSRFKTWLGMDVPTTADIAETEIKRHNAGRAVVDHNGVGAAVAPLLRRKDIDAADCLVSWKPQKDAGTKGRFFSLRDQLAWDVRLWLKDDPTAMLPPDPQLIEELLQVEFALKDRGIQISPKDDLVKALRRSPDRMSALMLTFYEPNLAI